MAGGGGFVAAAPVTSVVDVRTVRLSDLESGDKVSPGPKVGRLLGATSSPTVGSPV